jgi:DNA-binding CsgD family transcriptional regulator
MSVIPLIGRDGEAVVIEQFLESLTEGSCCLVLEGEVGIGKTTLLGWARSMAVDRGYRALSASPVESEVPWEFAALADLMEGVPRSFFDELPEPQRRAISVAVFRDELAGEAIDPRTLATAVSRILRRLADESPLLLFIDDLPWLDTPSARVLSYALRRAGSSPVGLVGTVRTGWSDPPGELVTDPVEPGRVDRVAIGPISTGAMGDLLTDRTGEPIGRSRLQRVQKLCRGNPMFALELVKGTTVDVSALSTKSNRDLDLPESLRRLVRARVDRLSPGAQEVVLVAALSDETELTVVVAAAADLSTVEEDLGQAVRAGILNHNGNRLVFAHPLIRSVVAEDATTTRRQAAHRRLADVVQHPESRARHLALRADGPDEGIALEVEVAANTATSRGACETAAVLAALAVSLTPPDRLGDRHRRMAIEAENWFAASDPTRACALLDEVTGAMPPGPQRAELLRRLARYRAYRGEPLAKLISRLTVALDEAGDDLELRAAITLDIAVASGNSGNQAAAGEYGAMALELTEQVGDTAQEAQIVARMAFEAFARGEGVRKDLVAKGLSDVEQPSHLSMELRPGVVIGVLLQLSDDLDGSRALLQSEYERACDKGVETGLPLLLSGMVQAEAWAGDWDRADELVAEGSELADEADSQAGLALIAGVRGMMHILRGRIDEGRRDSELAAELGLSMGLSPAILIAVQTLALAGISVEDPAATHERIAPMAEFVKAMGVTEPGLFRFLPDEIEALIRLGDLDAAVALLTPFERRSDEVGRVWGQATSARCQGLLLAARGELDAAVAALDRSLEHHAALGMPFEHGRTLMVAGEIHRRERRKSVAKGHLDAALAIFDRLGSPVWAARAQLEIDRLGLRKAAAGSPLTEGERRVADLASHGLTNAQIASQLFMSSRTVESHLTRIFRKLDVKSRTQMARVYWALTAESESAPDRRA